ncbi:MAG TPA: M15 family metallopeptidase [Casimicrobiaceae bacterium]|nr:M15 family metallopeptidase [Casimicrobiaceae bacterium]
MTDVIPVQAPTGLDDIIAHYGDPKFNGIMVDPAWESANMVLITDFPLVPARRLYVHKLIVEPLRQALGDCAALGDNYRVDTIGCFAPRQKNKAAGISTHTWGIAVDINAHTNPLIVPRPATPQFGVHYTIPDSWIDCFRRRGWMWGGDFSNRFDGMHFQLCRGY